jgi:RimJ/RimL family protein N-acetyltransferase
MRGNVLSVRELRETDIDLIADYWLNSDGEFLRSLGVDLDKLPTRENWDQMLTEQLNTPLEQKKSYCIIWEVDGKATGHSNINKIIFGDEAYMHLHIWDEEIRQKGFGTAWIKMTLPWFFEKYQLKKLYCEPYALNPAPNRTMEKVGFEFMREYVTTPGWINFEQPVKLWEMSYERFKELSGKKE